MVKIEPSEPYIPLITSVKVVRRGETRARNIDSKYIFLIDELEKKDDISTWQIIWWAVKSSPKILKLILFLIDIQENFKMTNDTKTTVLSIIKAILMLLGLFGINVSPDNTTTILTFCTAVFAFVEVIQGWFINKKDVPTK